MKRWTLTFLIGNLSKSRRKIHHPWKGSSPPSRSSRLGSPLEVTAKPIFICRLMFPRIVPFFFFLHTQQTGSPPKKWLLRLDPDCFQLPHDANSASPSAQLSKTTTTNIFPWLLLCINSCQQINPLHLGSQWSMSSSKWPLSSVQPSSRWCF